MPRGNSYQRQGMYQQNPYQRQGTYQQNPYNRQNQYAQNPYMQNPYIQRQMMQNQSQMPQQQMPSQMPPQMPYQQQMPQQQMPYQQQMPQQQMPQQPTPQQQMPKQAPQDPMVTYEPIDEKMLNEIRAGLAKSEPSKEPPAEQTTMVYALDKKYIDAIGSFIQNERNASVYYKNLSEKAYSGKLKGALLKIGEISQKQIGTYKEIYKYFSNQDYEISETEIISNVDFYEGVGLAILEESALLEELNDIYDMLPDDKSIKSISKMINRKISVINNLRNLQNRINI